MTNTKVQIRASHDEKDAWKEAAYLRRVSLSEWMRRVLNATAQKTIEEEK